MIAIFWEYFQNNAYSIKARKFMYLLPFCPTDHVTKVVLLGRFHSLDKNFKCVANTLHI